MNQAYTPRFVPQLNFSPTAVYGPSVEKTIHNYEAKYVIRYNLLPEDAKETSHHNHAIKYVLPVASTTRHVRNR